MSGLGEEVGARLGLGWRAPGSPEGVEPLDAAVEWQLGEQSDAPATYAVAGESAVTYREYPISEHEGTEFFNEELGELAFGD